MTNAMTTAKHRAPLLHPQTLKKDKNSSRTNLMLFTVKLSLSTSTRPKQRLLTLSP